MKINAKNLMSGMSEEMKRELFKRHPKAVTRVETLDFLAENCMRIARDLALALFLGAALDPEAEQSHTVKVPPFQPHREKFEAKLEALDDAEVVKDSSTAPAPTQAAAKA